jgi:hypothetical protein
MARTRKRKGTKRRPAKRKKKASRGKRIPLRVLEKRAAKLVRVVRARGGHVKT